MFAVRFGFTREPWFNMKISSYQYRNLIVEIRWTKDDRLILTNGFTMLVRWHLHIESGPLSISSNACQLTKGICNMHPLWKANQISAIPPTDEIWYILQPFYCWTTLSSCHVCPTCQVVKFTFILNWDSWSIMHTNLSSTNRKNVKWIVEYSCPTC